MAGHSKRHNIKHRKAAQDSKKAKIYSRLSKQIQIEAKNGDDLNLNPSLAFAVSKAKSAGVPKPVIEKAIAKGSGKDASETLEEVFYEGYANAGVALYIKTITSNTNRSAANIRAILSKFGGNMGQEGSVSWQFSIKGIIYVSGKVEIVNEKGKEIEKIHPLNIEEFENFLIENYFENYEVFENGLVKVITSKDNFSFCVDSLKKATYKLEDFNLEFIPDNLIKLNQIEKGKFVKILDSLKEDEDVYEVFHNVDI